MPPASWRLVSALVLFASPAVLGLAASGDEVDFSKPPPQGLLFTRVRTIESRLRGQVDAGGLGVQKLKQKLVHTEDCTEKIVKVERGQVVELTRKYVTAATASELETDRMLTPRKDLREELYSTLDFSATRQKDGTMKLRIIVPAAEQAPSGKKEFTLEEPAPAVEQALAGAFTYPEPLLPAPPRARRRVGDVWSLSEDAISRLFPQRPAHRVTGTCRVTLAAIVPDHSVTVSAVGADNVANPPEENKIPCARLTVQASLEVEAGDGNGLPLALDLTGEAYYSLRHHLIVQSDLHGALRIQGTLRDYAFDYTGTYADRTRVELHRPEAPPAPPGRDHR